MKQKKQKGPAAHHSRKTARRKGSQKPARGKKRKNSLVRVGFWILLIVVAAWFGWKKLRPDQNTNSPESKIQASQKQSIVGEAKVIRVIDGDTIEIEGGEKVRYIGMDTPEAADSQKPAECFSQEATDKNKALVEGKTVRLEKDTTDRDKYGRLLRYVYAGDVFVNLELVAEGFATIQIRQPDIKYLKQMGRAQTEAKNSARGLWAACPEE